MSRSPWHRRVVEVAATVLILLGIYVYTEAHRSYAVASVPDILDALRDNWLSGGLSQDLLPSLRRLVLGYLLACLMGVTFGCALGLSPVLRKLLTPLVNYAMSTPVVAMMPIAIVLLGIGDLMKVSLIAFVCCWPILLNTLKGVAEMDATVRNTTAAYGITGFDRVFFVVLGVASPRIFVGMRISLSIAIMVMAVSEMVASVDGIGLHIILAQQSFATADMWAGVLLLGTLGFVANWLFVLVEKRVLRWHHGARSPS